MTLHTLTLTKKNSFIIYVIQRRRCTMPKNWPTSVCHRWMRIIPKISKFISRDGAVEVAHTIVPIALWFIHCLPLRCVFAVVLLNIYSVWCYC